MKAIWAATMLLSFCCAAAGTDEPLEPEQAFQLSVRAINRTTLEARWRIADGCYLYRDKIRFSADGTGIRLGAPRFSLAEVHQDPFFGTTAIYRGEATVVLPLSSTQAIRSVGLRAQFQGCDGKRGICYPVATRYIAVDMTEPASSSGASP
ncbi:MAG: protein-disulfide reductase DsbD N-terminal domain-containing protein [Betaproteobacteria bacterium]